MEQGEKGRTLQMKGQVCNKVSRMTMACRQTRSALEPPLAAGRGKRPVFHKPLSSILCAIHRLFYFFGFHSSPAFCFQARRHCGDGISNVLQEGQRLANNIYSFWREEVYLEAPLKAEVRGHLGGLVS